MGDPGLACTARAGSNCPSILSLQQQRELCQLSVAAVKCMGFTVGVFHVECKYTSANGPQLIEVPTPGSPILPAPHYHPQPHVRPPHMVEWLDSHAGSRAVNISPAPVDMSLP